MYAQEIKRDFPKFYKHIGLKSKYVDEVFQIFGVTLHKDGCKVELGVKEYITDYQGVKELIKEAIRLWEV